MASSYSSCSRECGCRSVGIHRPTLNSSKSNPSNLLSSSSSSSSSSLRCPVCVTFLLQPHLDRYQQALQERDAARDECGRELERLRQGQATLSELQFESQRLLDRMASLQKECNTMAIQVTAQAVENEDRQQRQQQQQSAHQQQHDSTSSTRQQLERLRQSVCEGALQGAIMSSTEQVRKLRFHWAMQAFVMHRLDVDYDHDANNNTNNSSSTSKNASSTKQSSQHPALRRRHARGIGKIGGLPLPHAGPELYGVLPPRELQSALRLVASLTCTVARCLAIVLPHPILLKPSQGGVGVGDIIETVVVEPTQSSFMPVEMNSKPVVNKSEYPVGSSSTSSLMSLMESTTNFWGRSAKIALARATGQHVLPEGAPTSYTMTAATLPPPPAQQQPRTLVNFSSAVVARRILHATCAVLAEDSKALSSRYALSQSVMHQEEFAIALQLLQNNVIALCIRAGVPVNHLFPAEAMLLNLHALFTYCQEQIA